MPLSRSRRRGTRTMVAVLGVTGLIAGCSATSSTPKTTSPSGTATAVGVSATSILIGIPYESDANAVNKKGGAGGLTLSDQKADAQIVMNDINAHGGIGGRKLVPEFYQYRSTTQNVDQAECANFTQDHKVFAVVLNGRPTTNLLQCLNSSGTLILDWDLVNYGAAAFQRYPHWVNVTGFDLDRVVSTEVPALVAQHYFSPWDTSKGAPGGTTTKIGILTFDDPEFAEVVDKVLVPALAKAGYSNPDIVRIGEKSQAQETAAVQNAVLRFKADHVDHVITVEAGGLLSLFFVKDAETQHYRPRYAATTNNGFQALITGAALPKAQFNGSVGIGWSPSLDLPTSKDPINGPYSNASRRACQALMAAHGQQFTDPNAETIADSYCDTLYLLRDALQKSPGKGKQVSVDEFMTGLKALGSSFHPATGFGADFGSGQHDGGAGYYYWSYQPSCGCFGYTGPLRQTS